MYRPHMKLHYFLKREINELYIMNALRSFAISTITIFIPIFLLKHGFSFWAVLFYFSVDNIANIFLCFVALTYTSRKGIHHALVLSVPLLVLFFLGLYNIELMRQYMGTLGTLTVCALLHSLATSFYFVGFHVDFARFSAKQQAMKQLGIIKVLSTTFSIIGPFMGGIIISRFSFHVLFIVVILLLVASIIPIFFSRETIEPFYFSWRGLMQSTVRNKAQPFFAEGFRHMVARYYWPMLLFVLSISLAHIGGLFSISSGLLVLFTLVISRYTREQHRRRLLRIGTILNSLSLIARSLLKTVSVIVVAQGLGGLSWTLVQLPYFSLFYNSSKKEGIAYIVYLRELFMNAGRMVSVLLLAAAFVFFSQRIALIVTIITGAVLMLLMNRISE